MGKSGNFTNFVISKTSGKNFPPLGCEISKNEILVLSINHFFNKSNLRVATGWSGKSLLKRSVKTWKSQGIQKWKWCGSHVYASSNIVLNKRKTRLKFNFCRGPHNIFGPIGSHERISRPWPQVLCDNKIKHKTLNIFCYRCGVPRSAGP